MLKQYPSILALREDALRLNAHRWDTSGATAWFGRETAEKTLDLTNLGDTKLVPRAQALLSKLETSIQVPKRTWEPSPSGAFCIVPELLSGTPTPMRRIVQTRDDRAPIDIYVVLSCSAGIKAETLMQRGIVILALALALSRSRPISLHVVDIGNGNYDGTGETTLTARINTAPLDLARACYVLTSAGFVRRLMYGLEQKLNGWSGGWPEPRAGWSYSNPAPYYEKLKRQVSRDPSRCLLIPGAQYGDELLSQPLVWIKKQVDYFTSLDKR